MSDRKRHTITIAFVVLVSLTLLAAPARGADWFSLSLGSTGFGVGFGSSDWGVYGASWSNPGWSVDYHVALAGYGEWLWVNGIGQCWRPWVRPDWRPFTYGRWVWTVYGWTWVAYEPWGFFPHHYGHWAMTHSGWVWAPGTSYVAANVVWVQVGTRVGWYASPPPGWSHSYGGFHSGYAHGWHNGFVRGYERGHVDGYWAGWGDARYATFVDWNHLGSDDLGRHSVPASAVRGRLGTAAPRAGVAAPDRGELARRGISVPQMTLDRRTARVAGRDVMVARPREATDSIARNARTVVERALTPAAVQTLESRSVKRSSRLSTGPPAAAVERDRVRIGGSRATSERTVERRQPASRAAPGRGAAPNHVVQPPSSAPRISSRGDNRSAPSAISSRSSRPVVEPRAPRGVPPSVKPQADGRNGSSGQSTKGLERGGSRPTLAAKKPLAEGRSTASSASDSARRIAASAAESRSRTESRTRPSSSSRSETTSGSEGQSARGRTESEHRSPRSRSSSRRR